MLMNNIYRINKSDFEDARLLFSLSPELITLYDSFMSIKCSYNEDLNDVMCTPRPRTIKLFFRNININLKFIRNEVSFFPSTDATNYIIDQITAFIKYNLKVAKQNMICEKKYKFTSEGCLSYKDPSLIYN